MDGPAARLAQVAARQHGVFTTMQAQQLGVARSVLRWLVGSGWCVREANGVYRVRALARSREQRIALAIFGSGASAVASHRSALYLWGGSVALARRPEVSVERGRSVRSTLATVHASGWLPPSHRTVRRGLAVTTAARTVFDLAAASPIDRLERDADDLLHRGACTLPQLQHAFFVTARRGRPGTATMRALLDRLGDEEIPPASELERAFRRLVAHAGLVPPRFEVDLGGEEWIGRVDACWDEARLVVELDGRRHHGGLTARAADRRRDNELMARGWRVLRFTWDDLRDRPSWVVEILREALGRAA